MFWRLLIVLETVLAIIPALGMGICYLAPVWPIICLPMAVQLDLSASMFHAPLFVQTEEFGWAPAGAPAFVVTFAIWAVVALLLWVVIRRIMLRRSTSNQAMKRIATD